MLVRKIFIAWKKSEGARRYIIAKIKRNVSEGVTFDYCGDGFEKARKDGLEYFFGFQNVSGLTPLQVEQLLAQRVISKDRSGRESFLSFWEAENVEDAFDVLALTQGKLPTDNFEFLAKYFPKPGLHFVTDLAGISHLALDRDSVEAGDVLTYKREPKNEYDRNAVAIYKGILKIGYIKQIHNQVFLHSTFRKPHLTVKAVDKNGKIKQIFVSVKF